MSAALPCFNAKKSPKGQLWPAWLLSGPQHSFTHTVAMQLARTRAFTSTKQARNVQCCAVKVDSTSSRRQALSGVLLTTGLSLLPSRAWALIPDEEDEELLERAKANRQKRLAAQKETTRWVVLT